MLLAAMFMLFLFALALAVAVPEVAKSIQRDRELETVNRGKQYIRAIQLYYRRFGAYPPSIDALVKTNNVRFLRKKYIDPVTGKVDWKPIPYDPLHPPVALGFFGQPLAGAPLAGAGPSGGNTTPGAGLAGPTGGGSSSIFGGGLNAPGSIFGGPSTAPAGAAPGAGSAPGAPGASGNPGTTGSATDSSGSAAASTGSSGSSSASSSSSGSSFMSGQSGSTFGGAGIVGVTLPIPKQSILIYKKADHYNKWQFTYSPMSDMQQQAGGNPGIGTPAGQLNGSGTSTPSGSSSFGGGSFGSPGMGGPGMGGSGGFGSSPAPAPTQPQQ